SYSSSLNLSSLLGNAITSRNDVTFSPNATAEPPEKVVEDYSGTWPTANQLSDYYWPDVKDVTPLADDTIFVQDTPSIGPLYRDSNLTIKNTGAHDLEATLDGTVYVTGNLYAATTGKRMSLHLNNQTVFVQGDIDIGTKATIDGSGIIIAVGDVVFSPNIASNPDDFVFIMSIKGTVWFSPGNDFYGSVAGDVEVQLQPNSTLIWHEPPYELLHIPQGEVEALQLRTFQIN
ncbi:MAG: hypothetical protein ACXABY_35000, partial [Candidatus Thorarchaeota archaeon]